MITPILEKLLLNGKAKNRVYNIAFGMFAQLQVPEDSFIIIHKITWHGFINQKKEDIYQMSWKQFFRDNEYQLKIKADKEPPLYYIMRNEVNFQFFGLDPAAPLKLLNATISDAQYDDSILMMPKKPVIFDTWIPSYTSLNFTISRNSLEPASVNFSQVNQYANELDNPNGINGQNVLLDLTLLGSQGTTTTNNPPNVQTSHPPIPTLPADNTTNYFQLLDKPDGAGNNGSYINNPLSPGRLKYSDYVTNPLMSFEYVEVHKNSLGNI